VGRQQQELVQTPETHIFVVVQLRPVLVQMQVVMLLSKVVAHPLRAVGAVMQSYVVVQVAQDLQVV
jgi:hypothetical protein